MLKYNKRLTLNAQKLRKEMTAEERQLWYLFLRRIPLTINRQLHCRFLLSRSQTCD